MMLLILYYRHRWENISQTMWYLRQLTGLVSFFSWQIVYQKARQATAISTVPHCSLLFSSSAVLCHSHFRALVCRP